ncbi:MAG: TetR/AcrR family transcriptional regulator [Melioribacteraceae bacterium]
MKEKEKIVSFSKDTFLKNGFYKMTMDEIASGLHVSKKTIYKYFPSKNILVDSAVKIFRNNVKRKIKKIVSEQDNAILKIKALSDFFAKLSLDVNEKMLYDLQTHRPDLWKKLDDFRANVIEEVWSDIIETGKSEKCIVDKPNDIIITIILSSIRSVINPTFLINHSYSIKEAFNITFEIIIFGILTEKGKKLYHKSILENKKTK